MRINAWHISSFLISTIVIIPLITVFTSFFDNTSNYYEILKNTFLLEYISNSIILLFIPKTVPEHKIVLSKISLYFSWP